MRSEVCAKLLLASFGLLVCAGSTCDTTPTTLSAPTIDPNGGTFTNSVSVSLTSDDTSASIHYTTDGTEPDENSTEYGGTLNLSKTTTLRARAFRSGYNPSETAEATFTINLDPSNFAWQTLGDGIGGTAPRVFALAVYQDELIAGGSFSFTASGETAESVARWDGTMWRPLTGGIGGTSSATVFALTTYNDELIAGGDFNFSADGTQANNIARWDGDKWETLGAGTDFEVQSLAVHDGALIAGGVFTTAGGVSASHIALWNGTTWQSLGVGMDGVVAGLVSTGGSLFAGGNFSTAGGVMSIRVAEWNGSAWSALGTGFEQRVRAMADFGGEVIAGGEFTLAGGESANYIARWNGSIWQPLGTGANNSVLSLAEYDGALVAGGSFDTPGVRVARWNGAAWEQIGSGLQNSVWALTSFRGELIAGGSVSDAGIGVLEDQPIAHWAPVP